MSRVPYKLFRAVLTSAVSAWLVTRTYASEPAKLTQAPSSADVLRTYQVVIPQGEWRHRLYAEKRFTDIEVYVEKLLKAGGTNNFESLADLYYTLGEISADYAPAAMQSVMDEWVRVHPASHAAWLVRGEFYMSYGWQARGVGGGRDGSKEGQRLMVDRLQVAKRDMEKARQLNPGDISSSIGLMQVAKGLGLPYAELERNFQNVIAIDPGNYAAHVAKQEFLMLKWYGSHEKMFAFANEAKAKSSQYPHLGIVWARAYLEQSHRSRDPGSKVPDPLFNLDTWRGIQSVFDTYLAQHPDRLRTRSLYAYIAYLAKQYHVASDQFDYLGYRWVPSDLWGSLKYYNESRAFTHQQIGYEFEMQGKYADALANYQQSIRLGSPWSMTNLGWLYHEGRGVPQDYMEALRWYRKAADLGDPQGMANIGYSYQTGQGLKVDLVEARRWYRKAAEKGNALSQFNLGWLYYNGLGVSKDYAEALKWFQLSGAQGNGDAVNTIGWMYQTGQALPQDYEKAAEYYRRAIPLGNSRAGGNLKNLADQGLIRK